MPRATPEWKFETIKYSPSIRAKCAITSSLSARQNINQGSPWSEIPRSVATEIPLQQHILYTIKLGKFLLISIAKIGGTTRKR